MSTVNGSSGAFPSEKEVYSGMNKYTDRTLGLTKREYFAAMAMQGLLAGWDTQSWPSQADTEELTRRATIAADLLLKQLQNENK